jgi:hypothetical protein
LVRARIDQHIPGTSFHDNGGITRTADLCFGSAQRQHRERKPTDYPGESTGKAPQALATNPHTANPLEPPRRADCAMGLLYIVVLAHFSV